MKYWLVMLALLAGTAQAADELNLFNWNNAVAPATIKKFEAQCRCKVKETYFGSMEEALAKLSAGAKGFDVIGPSNYGIPPLAKQGLLQPLDKAKLPNLKNLNPAFANTPLDPNNQYSVPYDFTVTLVGYNATKLKEIGVQADTWAVVFDPAILAKIRGKVTVLDDPREVIAAALRYNGFSANSTNPDELKKAIATIKAAKPYWAAFNSQSYIKELTLGNIWVALGYSNDMYQAQQDARAAKRAFQLAYGLQKEGNGMTADSFVISKSAPRPDLAIQFIHFMLEGQNAAEITNAIGAGNPNAAAKPFIRKELLAVPAINPDATQASRLEQLADQDGKTRRAWNKAWTELKLQR
ncbi:polyamine ABC transporter substrate-binding protein [Chitinilyticum piscinae]|uniref:Putrescine-binding periplasmic protein n=1 Tax=Chitinilyticum piscinae TaxID=2866724 RepID=A0A8J7FJD3_9NEIS|nr:spermidine/putrescine ABC transporter substrate-binding protein [Chitinilyticum piscinae]MBE9609060.1 spermidine/putrescine ABC transporter substrate-binding protein [Chitinilyticum piscinae]